MKGTYLQNKQSIYNYREKNLEKCRAIQKEYKRKVYIWKKISKEFLAILRD